MVKAKKVFGFRVARPEERGYWCGTYKNTPRECPGCGRHHWIVGRFSSECAFCATAIPLADAAPSGSPIIIHRNMTNQSEQRRPLQVAA